MGLENSDTPFLMKTVLAFGTFDILHPGHISYLMSARKQGDRLVVVVARDKTVENIKGKKPRLREKDRLMMVQSLKCVDAAVLGNVGDHLKVIHTIRPDIVCLGYDHAISVRELSARLAQEGFPSIRIIRMKKYKVHTYKSSTICST